MVGNWIKFFSLSDKNRESREKNGFNLSLIFIDAYQA